MRSERPRKEASESVANDVAKNPELITSIRYSYAAPARLHRVGMLRGKVFDDLPHHAIVRQQSLCYKQITIDPLVTNEGESGLYRIVLARIANLRQRVNF